MYIFDCLPMIWTSLVQFILSLNEYMIKTIILDIQNNWSNYCLTLMLIFGSWLLLEVLRNVPARLEQEAFGVPKWFELSMRFHFCLEINDFSLISVSSYCISLDLICLWELTCQIYVSSNICNEFGFEYRLWVWISNSL